MTRPLSKFRRGASARFGSVVTPRTSRFFLLVFVLSLPFYLLGALNGRLLGLPMLPASALMTFTPMIAALVLVYRQLGTVGVAALLKRALAFTTFKAAGWYLTALLFMPVICVLEFLFLRFTGSALPIPRVLPRELAFFFVAFFIGAIGEEVGWQGYAYPGLRAHYSALSAALVLGVVWALWHVIPFVQLGRGATWIFWHCSCAVALRVIIAWLFESCGKNIVITVLFHTMINVSWALFPNSGSYYNPFVTFGILALAVVLIVFRSGPATLVRSENGPRQHPA